MTLISRSNIFVRKTRIQITSEICHYIPRWSNEFNVQPENVFIYCAETYQMTWWHQNGHNTTSATNKIAFWWCPCQVRCLAPKTVKKNASTLHNGIQIENLSQKYTVSVAKMIQSNLWCEKCWNAISFHKNQLSSNSAMWNGNDELWQVLFILQHEMLSRNCHNYILRFAFFLSLSHR